MRGTEIIPTERIVRTILMIRGQKVIPDTDLAKLYGVTAGHLNEAVKRNRKRFPDDFMFQLTAEEHKSLTSQSAMSKNLRGGRRRPPYVFTEHGVAMLSSVLGTERAIEVNIQIIRAFIRLRQLLASNADLARKLAELEQKYDAQFRVVFDAIRQLMAPPVDPPKHRIGYRTAP
jgi:hypothetical protein